MPKETPARNRRPQPNSTASRRRRLQARVKEISEQSDKELAIVSERIERAKEAFKLKHQ